VHDQPGLVDVLIAAVGPEPHVAGLAFLDDGAEAAFAFSQGADGVHAFDLRAGARGEERQQGEQGGGLLLRGGIHRNEEAQRLGVAAQQGNAKEAADLQILKETIPREAVADPVPAALDAVSDDLVGGGVAQLELDIAFHLADGPVGEGAGADGGIGADAPQQHVAEAEHGAQLVHKSLRELLSGAVGRADEQGVERALMLLACGDVAAVGDEMGGVALIVEHEGGDHFHGEVAGRGLEHDLLRLHEQAVLASRDSACALGDVFR